MKGFLKTSGLVFGGTAIAAFAAYKFVERKTKAEAKKKVETNCKEVERTLKSLAQSEERFFNKNNSYTDQINKLDINKSSIQDENQVQIIVNNTVPLSVIQVSRKTDKAELNFTEWGIGVYSSCQITANIILSKNEPASEINWTIKDPDFKIAGLNRKKIKKAIINKASSAVHP